MKKVIDIISCSFFLGKNFTANVACTYFLNRVFSFKKKPNKFTYRLLSNKHKAIERYLLNKYADLFDDLKNKPSEVVNISGSAMPIWVCWWQGMDSMPLIIKRCYKSICDNANGHPVILITSENFKDYVSIPTHVLNKLENKVISLTHFSDILRVTLLYEHGGLWLDSSIFVSSKIDEKIFQSPFYTGKIINKTDNVSKCRWTGFFMAGQKGNVLFDFMRSAFFVYWEKENFLIDYFLIDYFIATGYESSQSIKKIIDDVPFNNPDLQELLKKINGPFDLEIFQKITSSTIFHKLSWKGVPNLLNEENENTLWGYFVQNKI